MKTKIFVLTAGMVFGLISTSYARQDAFLEYQAMRTEQAFAKGENYVERAPAQAAKKDPVVRTEQSTRDKMERAISGRP